MDEDKLADLNDIQDFFNRSHSTSASGTFCTESIGIKDFIGWCNNPCNSKPEGNDDDADGLGKTVCMLEKLDDDIADKIYSILEDTSVSVVGDTDVNNLTSQDKKGLRNQLAEQVCKRFNNDKEIYPELKNRWGNISRDLPVNAAFYFALKLRLEDFPDEQGYYRYQFDVDGNTIAQVDPLKPFTDSAHDNLDQQWHVLISLLALLDVAHALNSEHHKYHCLYPYLSSYDKGDLNKMQLKLKSSLSLEVTPEIGKATNYTSEPMMTWIKDALVKQEAK